MGLLLLLIAWFVPASLAGAADRQGKEAVAAELAGTKKIAPSLTFCYQGQVSNPRLLIVDKSRQRIMVFRYLGEMVLDYEYPCSTGENAGDKVKSGDERTPEGIYFTTHRYKDNKVTIFGDRALHLNYPNAFDRREGRQGNGIYIHGTNRALRPRSSNGCVVMRNADLAAISTLVKENETPVIVVNLLSWPSRQGRVDTCTLLDKVDLAELDRSPGGYTTEVALKREQPAADLVKAYAVKLAELRRVLGKKVAVKTKGMALFGLGEQWILLAEQEIKGPKGKTITALRRLSLLGAGIGSAQLIHHQWVVDNASDAKQLAAWAPAPIVVAARKPAPPKTTVPKAPQAAPGKKKPAAASAKPPRVDPDKAIMVMLSGWLSAWQGKKHKRYIGYYAPNFRSKKMNRTAWYRHKRYLAKTYKVIRVRAKKVRIKVNGNKATVRFVQYYRSDWHRDVGIKILRLVYRKGRWQIHREDWSKLSRTSMIGSNKSPS